MVSQLPFAVPHSPHAATAIANFTPFPVSFAGNAPRASAGA